MRKGENVYDCPFFRNLGLGITALKEAVALFLEECRAMGTLETVLEEAGYRFDPATQRWLPRRPVQINRLEATFA